MPGLDNDIVHLRLFQDDSFLGMLSFRSCGGAVRGFRGFLLLAGVAFVGGLEGVVVVEVTRRLALLGPHELLIEEVGDRLINVFGHG